MKMKKLNQRGFTLIELLAIIVILAVILVIAIPKMLEVMDNSKKSSLDDSVKTVARSWTQNIAAAGLATNLSETQQKLYKDSYFNDWKCLTEAQATELGLDPNQYVVIKNDDTTTTANYEAPNCSMGKITNGTAQAILVVGPDHSMYVSSAAKTVATNKVYMYAGSEGTHSW